MSMRIFRSACNFVQQIASKSRISSPQVRPRSFIREDSSVHRVLNSTPPRTPTARVLRVTEQNRPSPLIGAATVALGVGLAACSGSENANPEPVPVRKKGAVPANKIVSKLPDGTQNEATIHRDLYSKNPEQVAVLIAGGTGDLAHHNVLYFLRMGAKVTITTRSDNPLELREIQAILAKLTESERQQLEVVKTPETDEGWFELIKQVSGKKKFVHFNNLIGFPAQENTREKYEEAIKRNGTIAKAAKRFEREIATNTGQRIQFGTASSLSVEVIPGTEYAQAQLRSELETLQNGPANTVIIRAPYVDGPDAIPQKATLFGLTDTGFLPVQPITGSEKVKIPYTSYDDIGEVLGVPVEGSTMVAAVAQMAELGQINEAITRAHQRVARPFVIDINLMQEVVNILKLGHASPYAVEGINRLMKNPIDLRDENFARMLGRPPQNVVQAFADLKDQGKTLEAPDIGFYMHHIIEEMKKRPEMESEFKAMLLKRSPKIALMTLEMFFKYPDLISWHGLDEAVEMVLNAAQERGYDVNGKVDEISKKIFEGIKEYILN